jgi:hypothetical protein
MNFEERPKGCCYCQGDLFQYEEDVPCTNNATEQAIGRVEMWARTVRGYKTWANVQAGRLLASMNWL